MILLMRPLYILQVEYEYIYTTHALVYHLKNKPISLLLFNHRIYTCSVTMYLYITPMRKVVEIKKKFPISVINALYTNKEEWVGVQL